MFIICDRYRIVVCSECQFEPKIITGLFTPAFLCTKLYLVETLCTLQYSKFKLQKSGLNSEQDCKGSLPKQNKPNLDDSL